MGSVPRILAFAGSLRKDSYNKKLVAVAAAGARNAGAEVTLIDLADYPLPVFDEDLETAEGIPDRATLQTFDQNLSDLRRVVLCVAHCSRPRRYERRCLRSPTMNSGEGPPRR